MEAKSIYLFLISIEYGNSQLFLLMCDEELFSKTVIFSRVHAEINAQDEKNSLEKFLNARGSQLKIIELRGAYVANMLNFDGMIDATFSVGHRLGSFLKHVRQVPRSSQF